MARPFSFPSDFDRLAPAPPDTEEDSEESAVDDATGAGGTASASAGSGAGGASDSDSDDQGEEPDSGSDSEPEPEDGGGPVGEMPVLSGPDSEARTSQSECQPLAASATGSAASASGGSEEPALVDVYRIVRKAPATGNDKF
jgi:hypothetical protein